MLNLVKRHKWNTFWIVWCIAWIAFDIAVGSYWWAAVMVLLLAFYVALVYKIEQSRRELDALVAARNAAVAQLLDEHDRTMRGLRGE